MKAGHGVLGVIGICAVAAVAAIAPATASAFPCNWGLAGGGNTGWVFDSDQATFDDASLFGVDGPSADAGRDNAFSEYGIVRVDGAEYDTPDTDLCALESGGREMAWPTIAFGDITARPKLYIDPRKPFGRQFVSLRNTSASPLEIDFAWAGQLGTTTPTVVATSSSGDVSMNQGDRWGVTCDDIDDDGCGDIVDEADRSPEIAHVFEGKGSKPHSADLVFDPELTDGETLFEFQDVTIGAGKTVTFMQIAVLGRTAGAARRAAKAIDRNADKYGVFKGMSRTEKRKLQNW